MIVNKAFANDQDRRRRATENARKSWNVSTHLPSASEKFLNTL